MARNRHHNKRPYDEFIDVSRSFSQERGPDKYRLLVEEAFHDRWLRCDEQLFHLGGSIKDGVRAIARGVFCVHEALTSGAYAPESWGLIAPELPEVNW